MPGWHGLIKKKIQQVLHQQYFNFVENATSNQTNVFCHSGKICSGETIFH